MADGFEEFDAAVNSLKQRLMELGATPEQAERAAVDVASSPSPTTYRRTPEGALEVDIQRKPRMVSVPNYTLGGKRMEGARPMTTQERTMLEDPAKQMARDAGAFASRAVNSAGLGLPGIVMESMAPNALAAIRENEGLANAPIAAMGDIAGAAAIPVNALARGGKMALEGFAALPKPIQAGAAFVPALGAPTEASSPTDAERFTPPGLGQEVWNTVKEYAPVLKKWMQESGTPDQPMTSDEYKQTRRTIQPKTYEEILAEEKAKAKQDPTYLYGPGQRRALDAKAEADAQKRYNASKGDLTDQDARLSAEYDNYVKGWQKQREDYYNRQFSERHPGTAMAMTVGGPIASALLTKGIFGKIDKAGSTIARNGLDARVGDDVAGLAQNLVRAENYGTPALVGKGMTLAEAAALPVELRMMQDVIDKKGLPPNAGARKAADERMRDVGTYASGMGYDFLSGAIGAATGALLNKRFGPGSPKGDLDTLKSYGRGLEVNSLSPDELTTQLAERIIAANKAKRSIGQDVLTTQQASGASAPASIAPTQGVPANPLAGDGGIPQWSSPKVSFEPFRGQSRPAQPPPLPERQSLPPAASTSQALEEILKKVEFDKKGIPYWKEGHGRIRGSNKLTLEERQMLGLEPKPSKTQTKKPQNEPPPEKPSVQIDDMAPMGKRQARTFDE